MQPEPGFNPHLSRRANAQDVAHSRGHTQRLNVRSFANAKPALRGVDFDCFAAPGAARRGEKVDATCTETGDRLEIERAAFCWRIA